jgi:prepilin-type N-terminal cleavage/methylation domain-containing protein/prepilin-type processing-associated H-X9-DG protein
MRIVRPILRVWAMTLIELVCVIAIIGVLAALLLPTLGQASARARRLQCLDHLHQVGIGFASFAHDHNGQFPMAVPASAGGSLEYTRSGYLIPGDFYFSCRHFQVASNELVTPRVVACPADTRLPASDFATLSNVNVSYFIGVNAQAARPTSVLAGDRNLTNDYAAPGTLVRLGRGYPLRWTRDLHRFKGNLLFSDGHVEQKNGPALLAAASQEPEVANLALPTVRQTEIPAWLPVSGSSPGALASPGTGSFARETNSKSAATASSITRHATVSTPKRVWAAPGNNAAPKTPSPPKTETRSTNILPAPAPGRLEQPSPNASPLAQWLAALTGWLTEKGMWWLYALLLLLVAVTLVLRHSAQSKTKRSRRGADRVD